MFQNYDYTDLLAAPLFSNLMILTTSHQITLCKMPLASECHIVVYILASVRIL